ncbi:hypothetical protein BJ742DRAFT_704012 [Cladochytrium replicatum]|nr:hypothetical protein BJ742DRAFT_704012 [Cladochytrium replicatum]
MPGPDATAPAAAVPQKGKRVQRPDEFKKDLDDINRAIEAKKAELAELDATITKIYGPRDANNKDDTIAPIRAKLDELNTKRKEVQDARGKLLDQIKAIQNNIRKKGDDAKKEKDKMQFKSAEEIDRQIAALEQKLQTGQSALIEEKRIVTDISNLKKAKKTLDTVSSQQSTIEADKKQLEDLRNRLDTEVNPQRDALNAQIDEVRAELDKANSSRKKDYEGRSALTEKRKALKALLDADFVKMREIRAAQQEKWTEWRAAQAAEAERRQKQYEEQKAARVEEKVRYEAERELENAEVLAYSSEIADLTGLIEFLSTLSGVKTTKTVEKEKVAPKREVEGIPDGVQVLTKKDQRDDDFLVMGKKKGGKKGGAANGSNGAAPSTADSSSRPVKFELETLQKLWALKVDVPLTYGDIERTISALEEKKAWFLANQASKTAENKKKAEEKVAKIRAEVLARESGKKKEDSVTASEEEGEKA